MAATNPGRARATALAAAVLLSACGAFVDLEAAADDASAVTDTTPAGDACGPSTGVVARAIDGDTIELSSGATIRYLLVDTPESTGGTNDCFGANAAAFNHELVVGRTIQLSYDRQCRDRYGRLLAYVRVGTRGVNRLLVERGYACVLHIPPNGDDLAAEFTALEDVARSAGRGMWGFCAEVACDD